MASEEKNGPEDNDLGVEGRMVAISLGKHDSTNSLSSSDLDLAEWKMTVQAMAQIGKHAEAEPVSKQVFTPDTCSNSGSETTGKDDANQVKSPVNKPGSDKDKQTGYLSRSPLHIACGYGQYKQVEEMLQDGADPIQFSSTGRTPLHEACQGGHSEVLDLLLAYTREVDTQDREGQSAAHIAAFNGEVSCLELLHKKGATLMIEDRLNRQPAHLAAMRNHPDVLQYLYTLGVDLECQDAHGRNPLHYAAQHGALDCLVCLIQRDCDITLGDHHGNLPIHYSALNNRLECVRFLMKQGASTEFTQNEGRNVTHMAALKGALSVLHWLLSNGLDPDAKDNSMNTALHYAAEAGNAECFNCLLHHGASLDVKNSAALSPLEAAKRKGHLIRIQGAVNNEIKCRECKTMTEYSKWEHSHRKPSVVRSMTELQNVAYSSPLSKTRLTKDKKFAVKHSSKASRGIAKKVDAPAEKCFLTEKSDVFPKRDLAAKFLGNHLPSIDKEK